MILASGWLIQHQSARGPAFESRFGPLIFRFLFFGFFVTDTYPLVLLLSIYIYYYLFIYYLLSSRNSQVVVSEIIVDGGVAS
ncbi:hypothetical protein BDV41DRAFT_554261 [Aspergillus transmontanensis]|uniref:Uncharacterized protein n=1 Tax=Aspergillus transmontanensis TaxID=1034304 RepID=A0A5N6VGK8_9EURO|nr:hypothetical protein BDV41DRAFT_554261 [Aspergillus transmontanensis]